MSNGMLWFDNSNTELKKKIEAAAKYYERTYNCKPNSCLVHPDMLKDAEVEVDGITVRPYRPVLPGHIWIGMEDHFLTNSSPTEQAK